MMIVTKDVKGYFNAHYQAFLKTFSECAINQKGHTAITSSKEAYNFDDISKQIYPEKIASVDCIFFTKKYIELIEFKGGLIDLLSPNHDDCKKKILHQNLQLKIVESLLLLITHIFPKCQDIKEEKRIRFNCVINSDEVAPLDSIELQYCDLAKISEKRIGQLIGKYAKQDCDGIQILLDDYRVIMDNEFNEIPFFN